MEHSARESYLETQVFTATPQKLRSMLIDAALGRAQSALEQMEQQRPQEASLETGHCRAIVAELLSGVKPDASPVATDVARVYGFLYQTLLRCSDTPDLQSLQEVISVLEVEQQTWRDVCQQLPDRVAPSAEEATKAQEITTDQAPPAGTGMPRLDISTGGEASSRGQFSIDA